MPKDEDDPASKVLPFRPGGALSHPTSSARLDAQLWLTLSLRDQKATHRRKNAPDRAQRVLAVLEHVKNRCGHFSPDVHACADLMTAAQKHQTLLHSTEDEGNCLIGGASAAASPEDERIVLGRLS